MSIDPSSTSTSTSACRCIQGICVHCTCIKMKRVCTSQCHQKRNNDQFQNRSIHDSETTQADLDQSSVSFFSASPASALEPTRTSKRIKSVHEIKPDEHNALLLIQSTTQRANTTTTSSSTSVSPSVSFSPLKHHWSRSGSLLIFTPTLCSTSSVSSSSPTASRKMAGFDMDSTLIETRSGRTFASSATDWDWLFPCIPAHLKKLSEDGFQIVIFSNQAGIGTRRVKENWITDKISTMALQLNIPLYAYLDTTDDVYRKPSTSMMDHFQSHHNNQKKLTDD